ncbi:nodulation protein NfeD [Colwelliaceae bacterium 6471]
MALRLFLSALLVIQSLYLFAFEQTALEDSFNRPVVPLLNIKGAIGPAVSDYLVQEITTANAQGNHPLIIMTMDTPGGLSSSLRDINKAILSSQIPIACLVYPKGARAASAGTYILYACHIAAMAPATTLGAATPVNIMAPPKDVNKDQQQDTPSTMDKKMLNDAKAYIRSLAQLRGRNEEWATKAVTQAATLTAKEALANKVINFIVETPDSLIKTLDGEQIMFKQNMHTFALKDARLKEVSPDWRNNFIATITDPNIAYILLLIGIYGLVLEFYSPGISVAGISGAITLLVALYALQLLPLNFSGLGLLLIGIGLMVTESLMPSFGIFGIGGVIAFVLGSIFLIDADHIHFQVSLPLIAAFAFVSATFIMFAFGFLWRMRKTKIVSGQEEIIGALVPVCKNFTGKGYVIFNGERWAASSTQPVKQGQLVKIDAIDGLTLVVSPINSKE